MVTSPISSRTGVVPSSRASVLLLTSYYFWLLHFVGLQDKLEDRRYFPPDLTLFIFSGPLRFLAEAKKEERNKLIKKHHRIRNQNTSARQRSRVFDLFHWNWLQK